VSFPAAEGVRVTWDELPPPLRRAIETHAGAPIVDAASQPGGFSPGLASRVRLENGDRVFVKAVSARTNPDSPALHRREARITSALPATAPVPRLRFSFEHEDWVVLAFDDVEGVQPRVPWDPDELTRVLLALHDLATALTPSPVAVETVAERAGPMLSEWSALARNEDEQQRIAPSWRARLDELWALESDWAERTRGDTLLHLDVRADNVLLTRDRCYFVDWPWACIGAAWVDLALMLPCVTMQGGPDPESVWRAHPLAVGVADDDLDALLAAWSGFLTRHAMLPPTPGLPTLRAFQEGQAVVARQWLAARRGWE
jgi:hypothetical protein